MMKIILPEKLVQTKNERIVHFLESLFRRPFPMAENTFYLN